MVGERIRVVVPLVLSVAGFVLAMIALFAGSTPGQMEDLHIVSLNVSNFGHDVLQKVVNETIFNATKPTATTGSNPTSTEQSWWDRVTATVGSTIDKGQDKIEAEALELLGDLNDVVNNATERTLDELQVAQWYSVHVMTLCQGDLDRNITINCTAKRAGFRFDIPDLADQDLDKNVTDKVKQYLNNKLDKISSGTIKSFLQNLVQKLPNIPVPEELLKIPDNVKDAVNLLNGVLLALFIFFALGAGLAGLSVLLCIVAFISTSRILTWVNLLVAGLATLALAVTSIISTVMGKKIEVINEKGRDIGITANAGTKFIAITWSAFAVMFLAFIFWAIPQCHGRRKSSASRRAHNGDGEKATPMAKHSLDSTRSRTGFFSRYRKS